MRDEPEVLSEVKTQISAVQEPQQAPSDDPAAAAFEELRREVAIVHRAVSGLAAERTSVKDYSETLGQILQASVASARRFKELKELPALHLTAETIGQQIDAAAEVSRRAHQAVLTEASNSLQQTARDLSRHLQSARTAKSQRIWLAATGAVCLVTGIALGAIIPGRTERSPSVDQRSPEARAAAILGLDQTSAGEHLIQTSAPQLWQDIVFGNRIVTANRHVLNVCLRNASTPHKRCIITMPAAKP